MRALWVVLERALARGFYRANAGWLTAAAFVVGSMLSGREHKALILAALADYRVLAGALLLPWTLYTLLTMRYARRAWRAPENEVLRAAWLAAPARRWAVGLGVQAVIMAPLWGYGALVAAFAGPRGAWGPLAGVAGSLLLLTVLGWAAHETALRGPVETGLAGRVARWRVPAALWWLHERMAAQPLGLLALKAVSVALLIGLCGVYTPATFDVRILTLGGLITGLVHAMVPGALYAWERARLPWLWNLPLPPGRRLLGHAVLFGVLLVPELLTWLRWGPVAGPARLGWALRLWAFPVAWLLLLWALLLWRPLDPRQQPGRVLPTGFAAYLLLMGRVPLELLTLAAAALAALLTAARYWRAENPPLPVENDRGGRPFGS